jgi:alkanesulfonate monooxygenase SsuD/methylene tetrahydromethanopterin reductase-like flavin-dependent oxidoreductase (luciferase family)
VKVAERAAVLDILSDGRLELGTGRSATWSELGGFGASPDDTKKTWDEYVRVIPKMWTQETFAWQGHSFSMPERAILPKPLQQPHPPMWVAITSPGTEIDAAERGLGALGLTFTGFAEQELRVKAYKQRIVSCEPVGAFVNDRVNTVNFLFCHEDSDYAVERGTRLQQTFAQVGGQFLSAREAVPARAYQSGALLPQLRQTVTRSDGRVPEGLTVGNPQRVIDVLKSWEAAGVDGVNFLLDAAGVVSQGEILASLRLFAAEVMPAFKSRPAAQAAAAGAS